MGRDGRLIVVGVVLAASAYVAGARRAEDVPPRAPLATCPLRVGSWESIREPAFDAQTLAALRVDQYVNRIYVAEARAPVALYIGYYRSQRHGATMHSPLNCLPGAGWRPVSFRRMTIDVPATRPAGASSLESDPSLQSASGPTRTITVNRYVIEKGLSRQLVLYWYQANGRVVASEYWGKIYLVADAVRYNRTEGALVRIVTPIAASKETAEVEAEARATDFARALFPAIEQLLP